MGRFKKLRIIFFFTLALARILVPKVAAAKIIINEIGAFEKTGSEWIEILNIGSSPIDMAGWKFFEDATNHALKPYQGDMSINSGEYAIIAQDADIFFQEKNFSGTLIDSSWGTLKEDGEEIGLKDADGNFIEQFVSIPAPNFSLERIRADISDYTEKNWVEHPESHSAGMENFASSESPPVPKTSEPVVLPEAKNIPIPSEEKAEIFPGDIIINEMVSDPSDNEEEWIELFNKTSKNINLSGWIIVEGSERETLLDGAIASRNFFVVQKPKGNLNNTGDIVFLKNSSGKIIDQISYGLWQDSDVSDNAPAPKDPESLARISDGYDTDNDFNDFKITQDKTMGFPNKITEKTSEEEKLQYSKNIIINEIYPNPTNSSDDEFIEIKNIGSVPVNLSGWKIQDANERPNTFPDMSLLPQEIFSISRKESRIALNNTGRETVTLLSPDDTIISSVSYRGAAPRGKSYSRDKTGKWLWTTRITANDENLIELENEPPEAVILGPQNAKPGEIISFDASDSSDPEGDELTFLWDFGDGRMDTRESPMQVYANPGKYLVALKVSDALSASSTAEHVILVQDAPAAENNFFNNAAIPVFQKIFLSEVLPDPQGNDAEYEFIEIYNAAGENINLFGWMLDDDEGGSKPYVLPEIILEPNSYKAIPRTQSKIALNNSSDSVRLFDPNGNLIDAMYYDSTVDGLSYIKNENGLWEMTSAPTPDEINVLQKTKNTPRTSSKKIQELVSLEGVVIAVPGMLGSQIMYVMKESSGVQIYSYGKLWPTLELGDKIEVRGIPTISRGEERIKISEADDIIILERMAPPSPIEIKIAEMENLESGVLMALSGQVTERKGKNFFIDDGTGEMSIAVKDSTGITTAPNPKDFVSVTGVLVENSSGVRVLPRSQNDIQITKVLGASAIEESTESSGENTTTKKQGGLNGYLLGTVLILGVMNGHLFWTLYSERKQKK